jgi:hypothetical protein
MNTSTWYETIQSAQLMQGDLLPGCLVSIIKGEWTFPPKIEEVVVDFVATDMIVMTQSCDLEGNKVDHVLLARTMAWRDVVREESERGNSAVRSRDFRKKMVEGTIPGLSLLHKHEQTPMLDWSVVDFHQLFTLPKPFVENFANSLGPRLRLRSPYREHLAQAFARYFMRVGLPHDAKAFEKEGDVNVNP